MTQTDITSRRSDYRNASRRNSTTLAAGLFGYSIEDSETHSFKPSEGYLRDIEQMPIFSPPSVNNFVAQYLASNIGKTHSSS